MTHIVYALVEGEDVQYVGFSSRLQKRRRAHACEHPDWQLLSLGSYPTRDVGLEQEKWWIKRLICAGHPLTNVSDGGQGSILGRTVSKLSRSRMSAARVGLKHSEEVKTKISIGGRGKMHQNRALSSFHRDLDPELVVSIYRKHIEDTGRASCASVVEELAGMGVVTRTGKPPTRQGIHYILCRSHEGRELLDYTLKRTGKKYRHSWE